MKLDGNTVLITGGGSGIGLALAAAFLQRGNEVIICGRSADRLAAAKRWYPALHTKTADLSDLAGCQELSLWAADRFERLNLLINNAGVQRDIDFTRGASEFLSGENELRIDLEAPILLSGLMVPLLAGKRPAAIINVTSGLAFVPSARTPVYSAAKAGLHAFSMALRHQVMPLGIQVFEVVPPAINTGLNPQGRARRPQLKIDLEPAEFAAVVMADLESDVAEIGYGFSADAMRASRAEIDRRFIQLNAP